MEKDFDSWTHTKKRIHHGETCKFYREREIWWCALGVNIGYEQDGNGANYDRPMLIIRGFSKQTCFGVALTGRLRTGTYYMPIGEVDGRSATVILSQVRLIDTRRLIRRMATLDENTFTHVCESLQLVLFGRK